MLIFSFESVPAPLSTCLPQFSVAAPSFHWLYTKLSVRQILSRQHSRLTPFLEVTRSTSFKASEWSGTNFLPPPAQTLSVSLPLSVTASL